MAKKIIFTALQSSVMATDITSIDLSRGNDLSATSYVLKFDITHTNADVLAVSDYLFCQNVIANLNMEVGAGTKVIDLPIRDVLLQQLYTRGALDITIDKTSGSSKKSKVRVIIDMAMFNFVNPKDSLFHTWKYNHRTINLEGAEFTKVADCTITDVKVSVEEHFRKGATANLVTVNGVEIDLNVMKKPVAKNKPIVGTEDISIEFPSKKKVTGIILFAVDSTGAIVEGCISNIKITNAESTKMGARSLEDITAINRMSKMFEEHTTSYADNIAFINIAEGQLSEAIDTSLIAEEDTVLEMAVTQNGHTNPNVRAIFLTIGEA